MKNGSSFRKIAVIAVLTVLSVQHVYSKNTQFSVEDKEQFESYWYRTGIYPYSLMTSVFSPVDTEGVQFPEKITMSTQEWCGHVFTQMNLKWNGYRTRSFSYFEGEHDQVQPFRSKPS